MRRFALHALALTCLLALAACGTRSISNSGYYADSSRGGGYGNSFSNELRELDVVGIDPAGSITEADIQRAVANKGRITLDKGDSILLIQSGAMFPDAPMMQAFEKHYAVSGFSGLPQSRLASAKPAEAQANYAMQLRLAAAKGGYDKIVAYWGVLETAREGYATKAVSWVPIIGWALPDEEQRMRIRLKMAVVDVKTGNWEMFVPPDHEDLATSATVNRIASDQNQVALLKDKAYATAADALAKRFAPRATTPANPPLPSGPQISL